MSEIIFCLSLWLFVAFSLFIKYDEKKQKAAREKILSQIDAEFEKIQTNLEDILKMVKNR